MKHLFVTIPVAATWPTSEELTARNAVSDSLEADGIGNCTGAGGGMGEMDFSMKVSDEPAARAAIASAMQRHMPAAKFEIRVMESE
jgi:hypothetical protein